MAPGARGRRDPCDRPRSREAYGGESAWPERPLDGAGGAAPLGLYLGAAGVLWALEWLARRGHAERMRDWAEVAAGLHERYLAAPDLGRRAPSLFLGETGILLVSWLLRPSREVADRLAEQIAANEAGAERELLWGSPGTMLAGCSGSARRSCGGASCGGRARAGCSRPRPPATGSGRSVSTEACGGTSARRTGSPGSRARGAGELRAARRRGPAANRDGRGRPRELADGRGRAAGCPGRHDPRGVVPRRSGRGRVARPPGLRRPRARGPPARRGRARPAGRPPAKGPGLCHGTAGKGLAFLELFGRTGDETWLEQARRFAMHAIGQVEAARAAYGHGRYTLWTGDLGVAVYLALCLEGRHGLPSLELW